ncbi:MAG: hypothetical protein M1813_006444 [Trichoglossum hirsutum]|nr:MAG: hypothetical protein M1813_007456 [Trichoglossum hirsutum]KAI9859901.1 MAG: hypothetical protein M1813_006444 [Trichoglossum hirsutum]
MALEVLSDTEHQDVETVRTEAAHILPFSLSSFSESERHYKATIWEGIFHMFPNLRDFSSADINDLRNVLTLWNPLHNEFGSFQLCLELSAIPNRYYIRRYPGFSTLLNRHLPRDGLVTFTAHDGRYALPDKYLLSIHASVEAVLHASGMAETIERVLQERDELCCLATDGNTRTNIVISFGLLLAQKPVSRRRKADELGSGREITQLKLKSGAKGENLTAEQMSDVNGNWEKLWVE